MREHDFSTNRWGHTLMQQWGAKNPQDDGSYKMTGCSTPVPEEGDVCIAQDNSRWEVISVEKMSNPADGFFCTIRPVST